MNELSNEFYEAQAQSFSKTRFCIWDFVEKFGKQFDRNSYVLDAGCGNGKNMKYFQNKCNIVGIDNSEGLVNICLQRNLVVNKANLYKEIPYKSNCFDYIICIAVIHHIDNEEDRLKAIHEMIRVLKPGGKILISCWAYETDDYSKKKNFVIGDNIVLFNKNSSRYYHIYDRNGFYNLCSKCEISHCKIEWCRGNWNAILTK